jgi:ribosome-binding factor A
MPSDVKRSLRVSSRLARELAWLLARDVNDPRVAKVTITRVEMTDDLRSARIFVRLLTGDATLERRDALLGLSRASGLLRKGVTKRMGLRYAPELKFVYDEGQDNASRIEQLLDEVRIEEASKARR